MKILVINCGSSSIKYQLFRVDDWVELAGGLLERIGEEDSRLEHWSPGGDGSGEDVRMTEPVRDHRQGMQRIRRVLAETRAVAEPSELIGIGHRAVHGGERFQEPTRIDDQVLATMRELSALAPLHNPANLLGMEVALAEFPETPQVAVFDTAFHQTLPPHAYLYALPAEWYDRYDVRRYGFHGTSCSYVSRRVASLLERPLAEVNSIILHLGNGASATAVRGGRSVDTSMGLTPLEGLIMGTRSGDIDPAIVFHLAREAGFSIEQLDTLLNKQSGMKGICGENDMRAVLRMAADGNRQATLAVDMYAYRIRKYVGAYVAVLGHVDALVFTAGVGENAAEIRQRICSGLEPLGFTLDAERNAAAEPKERSIHATDSRHAILVVPTNEELEIAQQTRHCIRGSAAG